MTHFERLCLLAGFENITILVGHGYTKLIYGGLEVIVWLVDPGELTEMEQDQQEEPC